jgi:hypothetical protein
MTFRNRFSAFDAEQPETTVIDDQQFEAPLFNPDLRWGVGDVCTARDFAEHLLADIALPIQARRESRLILTAACLRLHSRLGPLPTVGDLLRLLSQVANCPSAASPFAGSPMQFLQFVDAELASLAPAEIAPAVELCQQAGCHRQAVWEYENRMTQEMS